MSQDFGKTFETFQENVSRFLVVLFQSIQGSRKIKIVRFVFEYTFKTQSKRASLYPLFSVNIIYVSYIVFFSFF